MTKQYKDHVEDRANFSNLVMSLLTLPPCLLIWLRSDRGTISKDLGLRSVILFTLCCRVLPRLSHVPCPQKQARAVSRLEEILIGGLIKKRLNTNRSHTKNRTRDRVVTYIEKCITEYIERDFEAAFSSSIEETDLRTAIGRGDELIGEIVSTTEEVPLLSHILPTSILSFVCVLAELMVFGKLVTIDECDEKGIEEFERGDVYSAIENVTIHFLESVHSISGIVPGGEGRPSFSPASVFGRDGEISKIAMSNISLASALTVGSRLRPSKSSRVESELNDDEKITIDTFFAYFVDAIVEKHKEEVEYVSVMEEGADLIKNMREDNTVVAKNYIKDYFDSYEVIQRCNRLSLSSYRGPGVVLRSRYIPDIVRSGTVEKGMGKTECQQRLLSLLQDDVRDFRRSKKVSLDSEREYVRRDGKKVTRYACPIGKDICMFFLNCVRVAEKLSKQYACLEEGKPPEAESFKQFRVGLGLQCSLGLFGCDLSGNTADLYEEYIYSFLMRHFDEDEGAVGTLKAAVKRRATVRKLRKNNRLNRKRKRSGDGVSKEAELSVDLDQQDWGPTSSEFR